MHLQITNKLTLALDAFCFSFESAGALELLNEYSGLAPEAAPILPSQSSGMHVPGGQVSTVERHDESVNGYAVHGLRWY
jgi:hypothetical protein